nr:phage major capsid protein [Chloroflexota bacterium]
MDPIKQLEQAIQSARAQLASADGDARSALEAEIGQKSAKLADLKREQEQEYASDHDELIALRQTVNDQKIREQAKGVATIVAQGVKSAAVAEQERVRGMISDELNAALGLENGSPLDIKALVAGALGDIRTGRKFRYDAPEVIDGELVDDDNDAAGAGYGQGRGRFSGGKAASAGYGYAPRQGQGRTSATAGKAFVKPQGKASFPEFVAAAFRGDIGRIAAIQEAHGYDVGAGGKAGGLGRLSGGKALVEGGGAISAVTGPSGGYLVPVDFSTEMIERLYAETILRAAGVNIQTVTSPLYRQPRLSGGSSATYVGETAPIPLSQPTFDQVAAQLKKLTILSSISSELVNDSDPQVMD